IDSPPKAGQILIHDGLEYNTIKEGRAYILVPPGAKTITDPKASKEDPGDAQKVFYNPIQQFNRDLSVLAIRAFSEDFESRRTQRSKVGRKERLQQRKQKQKEKREKIAAVLDRDALAPVNGSESKEAQSEAEVNPRKRKSEDDAQDVATEKRQRLDESNTTNAIEPAAASALPTGQRPDDKLRPHMRILDALSATGLRALRYASELPVPTQIVANDLLPKATAAIKLNAMHNKLTHAIKPVTSNAQAHMYSAAFGYSEHAYGKYDVIDLDPYGSAVSFLDAALLALQSPGLLCVTCTDAGVFNSLGYLEKTYALYGGIPIKGFHAHEGGLRLILHAIATAAAKHGLTIEPLLSLSIDFYARVFVRVRHAPVEVKHLASKTMLVHSCDHGCGSWSTQFIGRAKKVDGRRGAEFWKFQQSQTTADKLCEHCGSKTHLAGPMWGGPLHNPYFIERILGYLPGLDLDVYQTTERIEGMLSTALEEL
ncbi:tRNA methyltransferase, partial [Elsinoe ampelina]